MKKAKVCTQLAIALTLMAGSASLMAAGKIAVSEPDITQAHVTTVDTSTLNGFVSIARGRNCVAEDASGVPSLLTCPSAPEAGTVTANFNIIQLSHGRCLSDDGNGPVMKSCDISDPSQQWDALTATPTHIKNINTKRCLTSVGLDKPLKLESCIGSAAQTWDLPKS